jgi:hypothetical protein
MLSAMSGLLRQLVTETAAPDASAKQSARRAAQRTGVVRHIPDTETWDTGTLRQECRRLKIRADAQDEEIGLLRGRLARYETALRGSKVTVSTQDRDLRYTSISNPMLGQAIDTVLGRTDAEVFPFACGDTMADLKREALSTGRSVRAQVSFDYNNGLRWHDLHVEPLRNDGGDIVGVTCASTSPNATKMMPICGCCCAN